MVTTQSVRLLIRGLLAISDKRVFGNWPLKADDRCCFAVLLRNTQLTKVRWEIKKKIVTLDIDVLQYIFECHPTWAFGTYNSYQFPRKISNETLIEKLREYLVWKSTLKYGPFSNCLLCSRLKKSFHMMTMKMLFEVEYFRNWVPFV